MRIRYNTIRYNTIQYNTSASLPFLFAARILLRARSDNVLSAFSFVSFASYPTAALTLICLHLCAMRVRALNTNVTWAQLSRSRGKIRLVFRGSPSLLKTIFCANLKSGRFEVDRWGFLLDPVKNPNTLRMLAIGSILSRSLASFSFLTRSSRRV